MSAVYLNYPIVLNAIIKPIMDSNGLLFYNIWVFKNILMRPVCNRQLIFYIGKYKY